MKAIFFDETLSDEYHEPVTVVAPVRVNRYWSNRIVFLSCNNFLSSPQNAIAEAKIYEAGKIPLSFVIVTKRIHSRIMTDAGNPPPGSVVDDTITCPERYDFFLVSQSVRQGTVTPTYYNVVHDTNPSINPERLQRLTYKLCHLYYNWSVSK